MARDYRLYELNDEEFERLVVRISIRWLGQGVTGFAAGKDAGRDGKFEGTAQAFPSERKPLSGKFVLQAKHVAAPNKSCSDRDFVGLLQKEHSKVSKLVANGLCDHYIVFTNRKLTAGADSEHIAGLIKLGLKSAHIIGIERLHVALEDFIEIKNSLPNLLDVSPFQFEPTELVEVIQAIHQYANHETDAFDSAHDFEKVKLKDEKNKINGLSDEYFQQLVVNDSMPHFSRIEDFLKNPRNRQFADLYHDAADDLKEKILVNRAKFKVFDEVFAFLSEQVQNSKEKLRYKRRMVRVLLHYMYCNCDIGSKQIPEPGVPADAHS